LRCCYGYGLDLRVTGYQFPDAAAQQRFGWRAVAGEAFASQGRWQFRFRADL
jgi:hypothetical protein